ncbi:hypothetical protein ABTF02_08100 [Acinetobacter baumannii]
MTTYTDLRNFGNKLVNKANEWKIPFQLLMYNSEMGCFNEVKEFHSMNMQTKYIILFRGDAFKDMQVVIDAFSPIGKYTLEEGKDSRQKWETYGRDVYQNVISFTLYQQNASSQNSYDAEAFEKAAPRMLKAQKKVLERQYKLNKHMQDKELSLVTECFDRARKYLAENNGKRELSIKRSSGVGHRIKLKPNSEGKQLTYSNLLILFGRGSQYPIQVGRQRSKGGGNPSISAQYHENPSNFNYYDKCGIFEVYSN